MAFINQVYHRELENEGSNSPFFLSCFLCSLLPSFTSLDFDSFTNADGLLRADFSRVSSKSLHPMSIPFILLLSAMQAEQCTQMTHSFLYSTTSHQTTGSSTPPQKKRSSHRIRKLVDLDSIFIQFTFFVSLLFYL